MTPQERQLVDDLFDRLSKVESAPRDPDAAAAIAQGLRKAPNAVYALVQTVLVQDEALKRANDRIQELEAARRRRTARSPAGSSIRCASRSSGRARSAVRCRTSGRPNSQPPDLEQRPGDAAGAGAGTIQSGAVRPAPGQPYGAPQAPDGRRRRLVSGNRGGGGGRHGRRIAAARQHPLDDGRRPPAELRR